MQKQNISVSWIYFIVFNMCCRITNKMSKKKCLKNNLHATKMLFLHQDFPSLTENPFKELPFYTRNFLSVTCFPPHSFNRIVLFVPVILFL